MDTLLHSRDKGTIKTVGFYSFKEGKAVKSGGKLNEGHCVKRNAWKSV